MRSRGPAELGQVFRPVQEAEPPGLRPLGQVDLAADHSLVRLGARVISTGSMMTTPMPIEGPLRHDTPLGGRSGYVMLDGRQVHYLEWGHARLPAVVCLHGGGQTAYMYETLGGALAGRFHVLAPDLPDHGDSEPLADEFITDRHRLADSVLPLCHEFGIARAVFVGGSLGGVTAATVAAVRPDLAEALVMIDVGHRLEAEGVARIIAFMTEPESFATLEEAAAVIAAYAWNRKVEAPRLTRNLRQRADGRWVWKHGLARRAADPEQFERDRARSLEGFEEDLRSINCPVLVLRGSSSDVLSEQGARELMEVLRDARLARIQGAGHLVAGDNPDSFVSQVRGFLDELGWGSGTAGQKIG